MKRLLSAAAILSSMSFIAPCEAQEIGYLTPLSAWNRNSYICDPPNAMKQPAQRVPSIGPCSQQSAGPQVQQGTGQQSGGPARDQNLPRR